VKKGILIIAACLLALSCIEEGGTGPGPEGPPEATSPANVLKCVEISFNQTDIKIIVDVLSEGFFFYFDPDDVGQNPPGGGGYVIPESTSSTAISPTVTATSRSSATTARRARSSGASRSGGIIPRSRATSTRRSCRHLSEEYWLYTTNGR
jgi:hypothetical protein